MSIDLHTKLSELRAMDGENEIIEFKKAQNSFDFDKIGQYFSALSNEANLNRADCGWLVLGVDDNKRITGTNFRRDEAYLQGLKHEVYKNTSPHTSFISIDAIETPDGRVIMMQVPPAPNGIPIAWKTFYYCREGESLVGLSIEKLNRIQVQRDIIEFELKPCTQVKNIEEATEIIDIKLLLENKNIKNLAESKLIDYLIKNKVMIKDNNDLFLSNLGVLLFSKSMSEFPHLQNRSVRLVRYNGTSRNEIIEKTNGSKGYAIGFEGLINEVRKHITKEEIIGGVRRSAPMIPELALREIIANSIIHQDFTFHGKGPSIEIFTDRIEVTNPGKPLIQIDRMIDAPAQSRNYHLSGLMNKLGFCEELGSGIDRALTEIEKVILPPIRFETYENHTRVTLQFKLLLKQISKEDRILCCYQHACLMKLSNTVMTNASLRTRLGIAETNYPLASSIISDAIEAKLVKPALEVETGRRNSNYLPYWA